MKNRISAGWAWNPDADTVKQLASGTRKFKRFKDEAADPLCNYNSQEKDMTTHANTEALTNALNDIDNAILKGSPLQKEATEKKAPVKKKTTTKRASAKKTTAKKTTTRKPAVKKTASTTKKTATKKTTPAKKTAAKKTETITKKPEPELIPLKKIVPDGMDTREARRRLRKAGFGTHDSRTRWEFTAKEINEVQALLTAS